MTKKWTQAESIAFESAQETMGHYMAILMHGIMAEEKKPHPDTERIARLTGEHDRVFEESQMLHVHDHVLIAQFRRKYGQLVRSWCECC